MARTSEVLDDAAEHSDVREVYDKDFQRDGDDGWELQWMDTADDGTEKQYWINELTGEAQWVLPFGRKKFVTTTKAITALRHGSATTTQVTSTAATGTRTDNTGSSPGSGRNSGASVAQRPSAGGSLLHTFISSSESDDGSDQ